MGILDPGRFLISCPECDGWPMAANLRTSRFAPPSELTFVCPRCGFQESAIISASGQLTKLTTLPRLQRSRPAQRAPLPRANEDA